MTLIPGKDVPKPIMIVSDKTIHALIFMTLTIFLVLGFNYFVKKNSFIKSYVVSALIALSFGIAIEFFQHFMNVGRKGDWEDALADFIGIIVAFPIVKMLIKFRLFERVIR